MFRRCRPLLGTFVEVTCDREEAIAAAFDAIERVHRLMSAHEADSELSQINRLAHRSPVAVSIETAEVLERARHWSHLSGGAFDVVRAGANAIARSILPLHSDQSLPTPSADWTAVDVTGGGVSLGTACCLDLGGIAKGYAVDLAIDVLRAAGAARGMVNAGGDLRGFGSPDWPVTIVEPISRLGRVEVELGDAALATSAGRITDAAELSFVHLPLAEPGWNSVTVRASNACDADVLTKIVWALDQRAADLLSAAHAQAFALGRDGLVEVIEPRALAA